MAAWCRITCCDVAGDGVAIADLPRFGPIVTSACNRPERLALDHQSGFADVIAIANQKSGQSGRPAHEARGEPDQYQHHG
jgi:hypothetical protein